MPNCKTIAICNQKGGTGKTTPTVNLGIGLAQQGKQVLLVDADPQGDLTTCLGWKDNDSLPTTITNKLSEIMREENGNPHFGILHHEENVDLLPANLELSAMDMPTQSPMLIAKTAFSLFEKRYDWRNPIRSVTIQAINLVPQDTPRQIDLFTNVERIEKLEKLDLCIETIRQRFGKDSIKNAVLCQNLRLPPEKAEITMPTGMLS